MKAPQAAAIGPFQQAVWLNSSLVSGNNLFSSQNEWRFLNLVRWKNPSDLTGSKLFVCGVKDFTALVGVANVMKPMQPLVGRQW